MVDRYDESYHYNNKNYDPIGGTSLYTQLSDFALIQ